MNFSKFDKTLCPIIENYCDKPLETFAMLRNPLDWLGSWYRYRQRESLQNSDNSTLGISFDQFVEDYMQDCQPTHSKIGKQAEFIRPTKGNHGVTHLFQYEY